MQIYTHRLQQLQQQLTEQQAVLLADPAALGYLTGFRILTTNEREGYLLITRTSVMLFAAAFSPLPEYLEQPILPQGMIVQRTLQLLAIASHLFQSQIEQLFLDENFLTITELYTLQKHLIQVGAKTTLAAFDSQPLWNLRIQKDAQEVMLMKQAGQVVKTALDEVLSRLTIGQTEQDIASALEYRFRQLGAEGPAFPTIVAFDNHASLPHYQPGKTALAPEMAVLIDCGACVEGYNSDITRTVWFGKATSDQFKQLQQVVDAAYLKGRDFLNKMIQTHHPILARDLDEEVRSFIEQAGFGQQYIHTTGHGIGWEVHEPPSLYRTNSMQLQEQMVITIEPGIYLPGELGYRHEDTFLITSQGLEVLTQ